MRVYQRFCCNFPYVGLWQKMSFSGWTSGEHYRDHFETGEVVQRAWKIVFSSAGNVHGFLFIVYAAIVDLGLDIIQAD